MFKPFDWSGTASRRQYWPIFLVWLISLMGATFLLLSLQWSQLFTSSLVVVAIVQLFFVSVAVRRLHDIGRSGFWMVLFAVPYLGFLFVFVLGILKPSVGQSEHWPSRKRHRVAQFAVLLVVVFALSRVFWAPFWIPSGSMKPTLLAGDYIVVNLSRDTPERGDVVVFRHPVTRAPFVSRVIGLAGDRLQMVDGQVILNDDVLAQIRVEDFVEPFAPQGPHRVLPLCANLAVPAGGDCLKPQFVETLPSGKSYKIFDIRNTQFDNTGVFTVPNGHFFVLGDNRDNVLDSRMPQAMRGVGFVPVENLIGKPRFAVFSAQGPSLWAFRDWRRDRFFSAIE